MESKVRMEKEVTKVLKTNENIARDAAEKKNDVIIYGLKEKAIPISSGGQSVSTDGRSVSPSLTDSHFAGGLMTDENFETLME